MSKIGAGLFALWGILHVWVGFQGLRLYFKSPVRGQWEMLVGGRNAPLSSFVLPTDPVTMHVHANLILNFCLDVGGYGVLGLFVAWLLYARASWMAYLLGVFVVGIGDVSFTFLQLTPGLIALNLSTVSGPIIWLIASIVTPFGLPSPSKSFSRGKI